MKALLTACAAMMVFVVASLFISAPVEEPARPTATATPESVQPNPPAAPTTVAVRVSVADYTESRPVYRTEVWLRGVGSWHPDLKHGADVRMYPGRRIGGIDTLYFYPAGRDAPELRVPVALADSLCPAGCDRDAVRLEVWDDRFEVWGPPVPGFSIMVRRR